MEKKKATMPAILFVFMAPLAAVSVCGCAALAAGAASGTGVAYLMGDLEATIHADPPAIAKAAAEAIADLDLIKVSSTSTQIDAEVVARTASDKKVLIRVKRETEGISKLSIRVGTFGDEDLSRVMLEAIKKRL